MDFEPEELQFLNIAGIFLETLKLIFSRRRLFTQIAASLMVPISALFLAQTLVSYILLSQIHRTQDAIGPITLYTYSKNRLIKRSFCELAFYLLFKCIYLLALLFSSVLSTAAVAYTVASVYSAKHDLLLSYHKVLSVVPKVWKRFASTFFEAFLVLLWFNGTTLIIFATSTNIALLYNAHNVVILIRIVYSLVYHVGLVWISVVWHVASVVSVLEEVCDEEAIKRSRELVKGKMWIAATMYVIVNSKFNVIETLFTQVVAVSHAPLLLKLGFTAAMLGLMTVVVLLAVVAQTVVYFVCKSYHHESIDMSALADQLEEYLEVADIQTEQIQPFRHEA